MKYLSQFFIILGFTLAGEALQLLIPLPIPASVYGIVLLFCALHFGLLKVEQVKEVGGFLTSILPILFVAPAVGFLENCLQSLMPRNCQRLLNQRVYHLKVIMRNFLMRCLKNSFRLWLRCKRSMTAFCS